MTKQEILVAYLRRTGSTWEDRNGANPFNDAADEIERLTALATRFQRDNSALISRLAKYDSSAEPAETRLKRLAGLGGNGLPDGSLQVNRDDEKPEKPFGYSYESKVWWSKSDERWTRHYVWFKTEDGRDKSMRALARKIAEWDWYRDLRAERRSGEL